MLNLYTETLLEAKSTTNASRLEFEIPRKNGSYGRPKSPNKSSSLGESGGNISVLESECLATASSFYFRETKHYPRVFSWRVIQEQRVLEIQPADLSRSEKDQREAYLTFRFKFQDSILPLGITLADPPKADELHVFVCTDKNEIFNLRLPTDYFRSPNGVSQNVGDWCRPVDVSSLSVDTVYHLHANSPYELFVAFTGGRIQALRRKIDSETWTQDYYDDSSWGSTLRGIVSRRGQQQIEYGSTRLAATTVQGMVASPDANYLYTVCLNHSLRIWHLASGKLADTRDLLNVARDQMDRVQLSPSEPGLIRLVKYPKGRYPLLVTYTPHEDGQFKFWNVKGGLTDPLVVEDKYPKQKLSPPDPDPSGSTVWSLTGFDIIPGTELKPSQLWVLWRNNNYHQVYTLHFDFPTLADAWDDNWVKVSATYNRPRGPDLILTDPEDVPSKWLEFIFFPGRYSTAVLEAGLLRYQSLTATKPSQSQKSRSLQDRLCAAIASSVSLRKYDVSDVDYDRFAVDTDHQWRNYWRILENLNDGRYAPLSFSFDKFSDMAWLSMADCVSAIRECSKIELLRSNDADDLTTLEEIAAERWSHRKTVDDVEMCLKISNVLHAAERFRKSFSPELVNDLWTAIEERMHTQPEVPTPDQIVLIFNTVGFSDGLSEGAEEQLLKDLQPAGGIEGIGNDVFMAILDSLATTMKRPQSSLRSTIFGTRLLSAALLDDIVSTRQILFDLLVLTIFFDESENFDPPELYEQLLSVLQGQQRSLWLATHFRLVPLSFLGATSKPGNHEQSELTLHNGRQVTILEDILTKSIRPQPAVDKPMMYLLTDLIAESQKWSSGRDAVTPEEAAVHIQCDLIAHNEIELATQFLTFQPSTPWSAYVKGRLRLARAEYAQAGICFRKAAYTLACGKAIGDLKEYSAGLLSAIDAEHFNNGTPRYFQHIASLFETVQAYAQAAEFASLSLEALAAAAESESVLIFRKEILSRLFTAQLKCAQFGAAYEAIVKIPDQALQRSSTIALVEAMLDPRTSTFGALGAVQLLKRLPWSLHPQLAKHLDDHLLSLAKKQTFIPLLHQWTSNGVVDYLSVLHALRLARNNHRGATEVLFDRLRLIQRSGRARSEPHAKSIRHALLALINALTSIASDEAYILADIDDDPRQQGVKRRRQLNVGETESRKRKRVIVTLNDLRKEYQQVLDRCSRIERGDFDFELDGDSDQEDRENMPVNTESSIEADAMEL